MMVMAATRSGWKLVSRAWLLWALLQEATGLRRAPGRVRPAPRCASPTDDEESLVSSFAAMKAKAGELAPFGEEELASVVRSLRNVGMSEARAAGVSGALERAAHKSHKDWAATAAFGAALAAELPVVGEAEFASIFAKVLEGGGWDGAARAAEARAADERPWVVLVTGVNGIRKTTSIYEPWFGDALREAIVGPGGARADVEDLPVGSTSFFRQLDFVIATAANEDFRRLYGIEDVAAYAAAKDAIFSRYRTVAEMVGALLVAEAKTRDLNVMLETSGRDVAMFEYVDHFFPDDHYRKLALNFEIEDLGFAERSVDSRMLGEMARGKAAAAAGDARAVVDANAGGPYGSAVLAGVQRDSRACWARVAAGDAGVGATWHMASLAISPSDDAPWTLRAATAGATSFAYSPRT